MKPPEFDFVRAGSVEEASAALRSSSDAKLLAGGQSLVPLLNMRLAAPETVIDIGGIDELGVLEASEGSVSIGAMVRQRDAELSADVARVCPVLAGTLRHVAHPQIRHRGTVGGSVAHADPAAELPAAMTLLEATMFARGGNGERAIVADDFFQSFLTTALDPDEVLTRIEVLASSPRAGWACEELARRPGDYALCGAVAQVEIVDGRIHDPRLVLFAVGPRPERARAAEDVLRDQDPTDDVIAAAVEAAVENAIAIGNVHATAEYRLRLARVIAGRALKEAISKGKALAQNA